MRNFKLAFFALFISVGVWAGTIHTWSNGDTLSASDLNSNFQHIHNAMVGGHGARLVDADVSTSAAIGYSKIQNGRGIARAWARVGPSACTAGTCTLNSSMNVTSITFTSTGVYDLTLNYTATNSSYAAIAQAELSTGFCQAIPTSTTHVTISCLETDGTPAAINQPFDVFVFDND